MMLKPTSLCCNVFCHVFDGLEKQPGTGGCWHPSLSALVSLLLLLQGLQKKTAEHEKA